MLPGPNASRHTSTVGTLSERSPRILTVTRDGASLPVVPRRTHRDISVAQHAHLRHDGATYWSLCGAPAARRATSAVAAHGKAFEGPSEREYRNYTKYVTFGNGIRT